MFLHPVDALFEAGLVVTKDVGPLDRQPPWPCTGPDGFTFRELQQSLRIIGTLRVKEEGDRIDTPTEVEGVGEEDFVVLGELVGKVNCTGGTYTLGPLLHVCSMEEGCFPLPVDELLALGVRHVFLGGIGEGVGSDDVLVPCRETSNGHATLPQGCQYAHHLRVNPPRDILHGVHSLIDPTQLVRDTGQFLQIGAVAGLDELHRPQGG